jgi:hypothetical protein
MKNKTIAFSDEFLSGPLKIHGFKKSQLQWNRIRGDFVDVVSVQEATYSTDESIAITINLGVFVPSFFAAIWTKPHKGFVKDADCTIRIRLGDLIQRKLYGDALDQWWTLTDRVSLVAVGNEVSSAIEEFALPFLDSIDDYDAIATHLGRLTGSASKTPIHFLNRCLAEWKSGNKTEAFAQLDHVSAKAWLPKVQAIKTLIRDEDDRKKLLEV